MPAGTITLTNNSTAVTGSGTAFPTELKANDFLVAVVGGTTYTLGVKSVESATALTLTAAYGGPTTSGLAWTPIPNGTLVGITAQIAADTARAIRGLNYDKQNWQQVYSASGNITVTLPDGSTYTGPSWINLTNSLSEKIDKNSLSFGSTAGTYCQGNDARLNTIDGKSGGQLSTTQFYTGANASSPNNRAGMQSLSVSTVGAVVSRSSYQYYLDTGYIGVTRGGSSLIQDLRLGIDKANGTWVTWNLDYSGNATAANGSWVNSSDGRIKTNKKRIENPLVKMRLMYGYTWDRLDSAPSGQGFIAQEVQEVMPTGVFEGNETILKDGTIIEKTLSVDVIGVAAALHHEAILALMDKVEELEAAISEMKRSQENLHNS